MYSLHPWKYSKEEKTSLAEQGALAGTQVKKEELMTFGRMARQHRKTNAMRFCRKKIKRDKAPLELNLATAAKDNIMFL